MAAVPDLGRPAQPDSITRKPSLRQTREHCWSSAGRLESTVRALREMRKRTARACDVRRSIRTVAVPSVASLRPAARDGCWRGRRTHRHRMARRAAHRSRPDRIAAQRGVESQDDGRDRRVRAVQAPRHPSQARDRGPRRRRPAARGRRAGCGRLHGVAMASRAGARRAEARASGGVARPRPRRTLQHS